MEDVWRFDNLTLLWFELSLRDTTIDKKYFYTGPLMFNVPNKALIIWFVTQFHVEKVIYIIKQARGDVRPHV